MYYVIVRSDTERVYGRKREYMHCVSLDLGRFIDESSWLHFIANSFIKYVFLTS